MKKPIEQYLDYLQEEIKRDKLTPEQIKPPVITKKLVKEYIKKYKEYKNNIK